MALPQRQEPDDQWGREYDEAQSQRVSDDTRNRYEKDVGRRNDLLARRRRSGWGWLWIIAAALFLWWAISHARHNRAIAPGTNNNPPITAPNNAHPNNGANPPNAAPPTNNVPAPQQ
jgi:hypothetical protein